MAQANSNNTQGSTLLEIQSQTLAINEESSELDVIAMLEKLDFAKSYIKELDRMFKDLLIDWINANGQLVVGDKRYYVGTKKTVKPRALAPLTEALMNATGGDFEAFIKTMSAGAYKQGACKEVLGDAWADHFSVQHVDDIKTGKPQKELKITDDRFSLDDPEVIFNG